MWTIDRTFYSQKQFLLQCPFCLLGETCFQASQALTPSHPPGLCSNTKAKLSFYSPVPLWTTQVCRTSLYWWLLVPRWAPRDLESFLGPSSQMHHFYFCLLGNSLLSSQPPVTLFHKSPSTSEESILWHKMQWKLYTNVVFWSYKEKENSWVAASLFDFLSSFVLLQDSKTSTKNQSLVTEQK